MIVVEKLAEVEVNEPLISSAICAELDNKVGLLAILSYSTNEAVSAIEALTSLTISCEEEIA